MTDGKEMRDQSFLGLSSRRPWLLAFVLMSLVFVCGVVLGIVVTSGFLWNRTIGAFRPVGFPVGRLADDLRRDLLLSDEQSEKVESMLESHRIEIEAIREEFDPRIETALESLRKDIESALNPQQADRWNRRFDEMKRNWRPPPPGPPRPPPHSQRPH